MDKDKSYSATLTLTSVGDNENVKFELVFSDDRDALGDEQPVAYKVMDFINETSIMPFISMIQQYEALEVEETKPALALVN